MTDLIERAKAKVAKLQTLRPIRSVSSPGCPPVIIAELTAIIGDLIARVEAQGPIAGEG